MDGFDVELGLAYIAANSHLTGELEELEALLPVRKSNSKTELKMSALKSSWDPREKFIFREQKPNDREVTKENNSLATPGTLAHPLQRRTTCNT